MVKALFTKYFSTGAIHLVFEYVALHHTRASGDLFSLFLLFPSIGLASGVRRPRR